MYIPEHFAEHDTQVLWQLMGRYPLGTLVTHGENGLDANHLPFECDAEEGSLGCLRGHVARANPVWQDVRSGDDVLVVFRGADAYISPNWYPSKHAFHKQVPTWNYETVHAHGQIVIHDDERFVRGLVARLTRAHEAGQPVPWKMSDSPREHIDLLLTLIVGIEIKISRLVGKRKLSQNKDAHDRLGAGNALMERGSTAIGQAMLDTVHNTSS